MDRSKLEELDEEIEIVVLHYLHTEGNILVLIFKLTFNFCRNIVCLRMVIINMSRVIKNSNAGTGRGSVKLHEFVNPALRGGGTYEKVGKKVSR